ncbi:MAG: hypothetical protein HZB77_06210 [Chloroflexi bacterium]|nr:hypothetical protein [Chloroflexota bacterium]
MKLKVFLLALLLVACEALPTTPAQIQPPFPTSGMVEKAGRTYVVESGWFNGKAIQYYNMGTNTSWRSDDSTRLKIEPVWVFATGVAADGSPNKLAGQDALFDVKPGEAAYTDLWQAHFVTPTSDYKPNSVTSLEALNKSGLKVEKQAMFVNCPLVPADSKLDDGAAIPLQKGWVKGEPVFYFDFGPTNPKPGKVYAFVTGFDSNKQPQLVAGQHFIFDSTRGATGYSDFWIVQWVTVDANYKADSIKTSSEIKFKVEPSTWVVNYPHK